MTAKQGRIISTVAMALLAFAIAANVALLLLRHRPLGDVAGMLPGLVLIVLFASLRSRYIQLEAEHGPDYQATRTRGRSLLIILALVLAIAGGLTAFLLTHRG
jgi:uncharacterized membrane protein